MSRARLAAQTAFELRLLARNGENLLVTIAIPLGVLVFFSLVPVLPAGDRAPVDTLAPGALTLAVMGSAMVSLGISTGFEREQLVLKRLAVTPLRPWELIAAKTAAVGAVQAVQVALLAATAAALGWRPAVSVASALAAVCGLVLASVAFAGLGLVIAGRLPALRALAVINGAFLVLVLLAGVIVPLHALPGPLAAVALALPAAWTTSLLSAGLGSASVLWPGLGVLALWAAVAGLAAARLFRWE